MVGDILLVQTRKRPAYMQVAGITNIAGKAEIRKYKKAIGNITAYAFVQPRVLWRS